MLLDLPYHGQPEIGPRIPEANGIILTSRDHHRKAVDYTERNGIDRGLMPLKGTLNAVGPNYNYPWELQDPAGKAMALARAHDSPRAALALVGRATAPERALIEALPARYPQRDPIDDQRPWNDAFADAMRLAHQTHPDDLDLRAIFAEAILNRTPWRMRDLRTGEPARGAGTIEAREVLESAFRHLPYSAAIWIGTRIASPENVPQTSSVASPPVFPLPH